MAPSGSSNRPDRLLAHLNGSAGSGKTFTIRTVVQAIGRALFLLLAPTGCAAFLFDGSTIHSKLKIPPKLAQWKELTGRRLKDLQEEMQHVRIIFIDEKSMIGCSMLARIDARLCQAFPRSEKSFGGRSVILVGDFKQLSPVFDCPLYMEPKGNPDTSLTYKTLVKDGRLLYKQFDCSFNLLQSMRQIGEDAFQGLLSRVGYGIALLSDYNVLRSRFIGAPGVNESEFGEAIHLFANKEPAKQYNLDKLKETVARQNQRGIPTGHAKIKAVHTGGATAATADSDAAGGLHKVVHLCVGARVMLTSNLWTRVGLMNGAVGTVEEIVYRSGSGESGTALPSFVLVNFDRYSGPPAFPDKPTCIPIKPVTTSFTVGYNNCTRQQLPLMLSWAVTIHKAQGQTLDRIVLHMGADEFSSGLFYVAISRVKRLQHMLIEPFEFARMLKITELGEVEVKITEERRLQNMDRMLEESQKVDAAALKRQRQDGKRQYEHMQRPSSYCQATRGTASGRRSTRTSQAAAAASLPSTATQGLPSRAVVTGSFSRGRGRPRNCGRNDTQSIPAASTPVHTYDRYRECPPTCRNIQYDDGNFIIDGFPYQKGRTLYNNMSNLGAFGDGNCMYYSVSYFFDSTAFVQSPETAAFFRQSMYNCMCSNPGVFNDYSRVHLHQNDDNIAAIQNDTTVPQELLPYPHLVLFLIGHDQSFAQSRYLRPNAYMEHPDMLLFLSMCNIFTFGLLQRHLRDDNITYHYERSEVTPIPNKPYFPVNVCTTMPVMILFNSSSSHYDPLVCE